MLLNFKKNEITNADHLLYLAMADGDFLNECQMLDMASPIGLAEEVYRSHTQATRRIDQTFVVAQFIHFIYQCAEIAAETPQWLEAWLMNPFSAVTAQELDPSKISAKIKVLIEGNAGASADTTRALIDVVRHFHDVIGRDEFKRVFRQCFTESTDTYTATFKAALERQTASTYLMLISN